MKVRHAIRNIIVIVFCLIPMRHWALSFDDMLSAMDASSLPQVNVMFNLDSLSSLQFTPGTIVIAEHNGEGAITTQHNCLVRHRGKTALQLPKMSLSIKLVDEEGENLDVNVLGLRTDNSWNLDAMGIDKMRMRNRVCFDIWNEFSHTMWDTKFGNRNGIVGTMVELFINGQYNGIYHLSDKVNRQLLNLRKAKTNDDGTVTVKGLLYKGAHNGVSNNLLDYIEESTDTTLWNTFELQYPDDYTCLASWQPLIHLIDFNGKTELAYFREHYNEWYYIDNLIDYFILLVAFNIDDMPYNNTFLSVPDINFNHRFMITPWDLDACLGRGCDGTPRLFLSHLSHLNSKAPYNRLITYNIDGFKQQVKQRWDELSITVLSPDNVQSHITQIAARFIESGAWQREYERWKDASDSRVIIGEDLNEEVEFVMQWYRANHSSLNEQFVRWSSDYVEDPNIITSSVITNIYNYLLGIDTSGIDMVDINKDGIVTAADITAAYNILLYNNF